MKINSGEMHSDLEQAERDEILYKFKSGQIDVLVATDIVARGIDIDDIAMVINFDVPHDPEDYVHRIGRTARAQRDGIAITFVAEDEIYSFKQIEKFLGREVEKAAIPEELGETPDYNAATGKSRNNRNQRGRGRDNNGKNNAKGNGRNAKGKNRKPKDNAQANAEGNNAQGNAEGNNVKANAEGKSAAENNQPADAAKNTRKRKPRRKPENSENAGENGEKPKRNNNAGENGEKPKRNNNAGENGEKPKRNNQQRRRQQHKPGEERRQGNRQRTDRKEQKTNKPVASVPAVKQSSALTQILKKPLSWLKSLGKKKD